MLLRVLLPEQSLVNTSPLSRGHCIGSLSPTALSTIPLSHLHKTTPQYLQEPVFQYNRPRSLRSSSLYRLNISWFGENTNKNVQGQGHSAMLHPPSGTGCQTTFTKQNTLLPFSGSWNHICFQLCDPLIPLPLFPPPCPPLIVKHFILLNLVQWACCFPEWSQT